MTTLKKLIHETLFWSRKAKNYRLIEDFKKADIAAVKSLKNAGNLHKEIEKQFRELV